MDILPLNSPSLNTLLRSAGLKSDFQVQRNFDEQNFSTSFRDKLPNATTEKYEPGKTNYRQPEASYFSLIQPQFQSNTPISKENDVKNSNFEKSTFISQKNKFSTTKFNNIKLNAAKIYSASTEVIGTGYFVTAPSNNSNTLDLIPEQKQINSKFKIYFDQTKSKGTLVNVTL